MAPKTKEQFQSIREQSMKTIKEVALELFSQHGYSHTSISMISKKAGISKGLMYNYFESKLDLLRAIVMDAIKIGEDMVSQGMETSNDPSQKLIGLIRVSFKTVKGNPDYWKLITALAFQGEVYEKIQDLVGEKNLENMMAVVPLFEALGYEEPEKEALTLGAILDGVMMAFLSIKDDYPINDMEEYLVKKYTIKNDLKPE